MIYIHSLGRASRYYPERAALAGDGTRLSFRELNDRVNGIAAALTTRGFEAGDRLALLLPNGPAYIELVYACALLGVIAVPLNTRLSAPELDRVLADANPHGLVRHSSLPGLRRCDRRDSHGTGCSMKSRWNLETISIPTSLTPRKRFWP